MERLSAERKKVGMENVSGVDANGACGSCGVAHAPTLTGRCFGEPTFIYPCFYSQ
jgi:hypothetical protein